MTIAPEAREHFLHGLSALSLLHDEQEAASYLSGVEGYDADLFVVELLVLGKEIFQGEKELVFLLAGEADESDILDDIDKNAQSPVLVDVLE